MSVVPMTILLGMTRQGFCETQTTPRLGLRIIPYYVPQQHILINQALWTIDALMFPMLAEFPADASPDLNDPDEGDLFIVPPAAEGDWENHVSDLAVYQNAAWQYIQPVTGYIVYKPIRTATEAYKIGRASCRERV